MGKFSTLLALIRSCSLNYLYTFFHPALLLSPACLVFGSVLSSLLAILNMQAYIVHTFLLTKFWNDQLKLWWIVRGIHHLEQTYLDICKSLSIGSYLLLKVGNKPCLLIILESPTCSLIRPCSLNHFLKMFHPALLLGPALLTFSRKIPSCSLNKPCSAIRQTRVIYKKHNRIDVEGRYRAYQ